MQVEHMRQVIAELLTAVNRNELPTVDAPTPMGLTPETQLYLDMRLEQLEDMLDH